MTDLNKQIEDAFHYRGDVTIRLNDNSTVEGFLYNRDFAPRDGSKPFVELFKKSTDDQLRLDISAISAIAVTGEDCAAGKSYQDWIEKNKSSFKSAS